MTKSTYNSKMQTLIIKAKLLQGLALTGKLPVNTAVTKLKADINNLEAQYTASLSKHSL